MYSNLFMPLKCVVSRLLDPYKYKVINIILFTSLPLFKLVIYGMENWRPRPWGNYLIHLDESELNSGKHPLWLAITSLPTLKKPLENEAQFSYRNRQTNDRSELLNWDLKTHIIESKDLPFQRSISVKITSSCKVASRTYIGSENVYETARFEETFYTCEAKATLISGIWQGKG